MTKGISASEMTNDLEEIRVQFRGTVYVLRELPMAEYDKTVDQATHTDPETKEETFDGTAHTKILLAKSLVEPKLTVDQLYGRGTRLVRGLQAQLQKLYWSTEPDELELINKSSDKMAEKLGDEDEGQGEATAATS